MSPPVFSPIVGDLVMAHTREGWKAATVSGEPDDGRPFYVVRLSDGGGELARSIFDLRGVDLVEEEADTDVFDARRVPRRDIDDVARRHSTRHKRFVRRVELCRELLDTIVDAFDPETPNRMAKALEDLTDGYDQGGADDLRAMLKTFPVDGDPGIVVVRGVPFASVCEHHVLPFTGTADVAYLPSDRIVGLSKIPRLVRAVSRRLQVQERIGSQVADALMAHVAARGVLVVLRGRHSCMALRGAESPGEMVTSAARGVLLDNPAARAEALSLMGG